MLDSDAPLGDVIESARRALALAERRLADADQELAHELADAVMLAAAVIGRLDAVQAEFEEAADNPIESAAQGREYSRLLISSQREVSQIVRESVAQIGVKAIALQRLNIMYLTR